MAKSKKVLSLALAVVMAISMLSIGAFAAKTTPAATLTVSASKTEEIQKGEAVTVTVAATASEDYFVGPTSVPVTYDATLFEVSNVTATNLFGEGTTEVVTNTNEAGKVTVVITPKTAGEPVATNLNGQNVTFYTFTLTAIADAGSCDVAVVNDQKTAANLTGKLYITSFDSADPRTAELTNVGQTLDLTNATVTLSIGSAMQPADLALKAAGETAGVVIDTAKTFGGRYDGVVYGFTGTTLNAAFYNNLLEATNEGSLTYTKSPFLSRGSTFGTGATITVKNADATVSKTYVIVIFGDTTGDGKVLAADLSEVQKHIQGTKFTDELKVMASNVVPAARGTTAAKAKALHDVLANDLAAVQKSILKTATLEQDTLASAHAALNEYYQ